MLGTLGAFHTHESPTHQLAELASVVDSWLLVPAGEYSLPRAHDLVVVPRRTMSVCAIARQACTVPRARLTIARRGARRTVCDAASDADNQGAATSLPSGPTQEQPQEVVLSPEDLVRAQYKTDDAQKFGDSILGGTSEGSILDGSSVVTGTEEEMRDLVPFGANNLTVLRATKEYVEAFEAGQDPSVVVARALGVKSLDDLTPAQRRYSEKVLAKLEENARRLRGELLEATRLYKKGVYAYSKGMYDDSVKWMDAALEETNEKTQLGGKIMIQKALGLYAYGRVDDAVELYGYIIAIHPDKRIKEQAEELKYILEAPQMPIGDDERVDVPLLKDDYAYGGYRDKWGTSGKPAQMREEPEKNYDDDFTPNVRLPQNPLITVAGLTVALAIAAYSATLAR